MYAVRTGPIPTMVARSLARTATAAGLGTQFAPGAGPWMFNTRLNAITSLTSHDDERCLVQRAWFETCPRLRLDGITYGWGNAAFNVTARFDSPGFFESIATPILLGSAAREFFVNPKHHRRAAVRLPDCKLVTYPGAKHELFMEADEFRNAWFGEIDAFIATRVLSP
jgi:lysophospholipase